MGPIKGCSRNSRTLQQYGSEGLKGTLKRALINSFMPTAPTFAGTVGINGLRNFYGLINIIGRYLSNVLATF